MKNQFLTFKALHEANEPLLIANVWNAQSARVFEKLGFKAIATSSAAVAETLGYADGEEMTFEEYLFVVKHIVRATSLPVSVDLEAGYGADAEAVANNIRQLVSVGVAGINIEDSLVRDGKRSLVDAFAFAGLLKEIAKRLKTTDTKIFINVRCDAFLLGVPSAVDEATTRMKLYRDGEIHGLFFPCITDISDIRTMVQRTALPVNVMCMPALPAFAQLKDAGVKRISMGNFVNRHIYGELEKVSTQIVSQGNFAPLF